MKIVRLTARQYRHFVYPAIAHSTAASPDEFEVQVRLIRKLKSDQTKEIPVTERDLEEAREQGRMAFPMREVIGDFADFSLQEDEWKVFKRRLDANKVNVPAVMAEEYAEAIAAVENPEEKPDG